MTTLSLLLAADGKLDVWSLVSQATPVVQGVMLLLFLMSAATWYIIGYKYFQINRSLRESEQFTDAFWHSQDIEQIYSVAQRLKSSPLSQMFLAGYTELSRLQKKQNRDRELDLEHVERSLSKTALKEQTRLEAMTPFLATTGSAAPFIGLFGTVWGIMNSFRAIGVMKSASIQTVAPGIAEALIATAIGLVAAIPAVMAYNYFVRRIRVVASEMDTFSKDFLNIVGRHFLD